MSNGVAEVQVFSVLPVTSTAVNNTSPMFAYAGDDWVESANRGIGDFGDDVQASNTVGSTATFTWTGTAAAIYSETYSDQGLYSITLDGAARPDVDTSSANRGVQVPIFSVSGLGAGTHTVVITHSSGSWMTIDSATWA